MGRLTNCASKVHHCTFVSVVRFGYNNSKRAVVLERRLQSLTHTAQTFASAPWRRNLLPRLVFRYTVASRHVLKNFYPFDGNTLPSSFYGFPHFTQTSGLQMIYLKTNSFLHTITVEIERGARCELGIIICKHTRFEREYGKYNDKIKTTTS